MYLLFLACFEALEETKSKSNIVSYTDSLHKTEENLFDMEKGSMQARP